MRVLIQRVKRAKVTVEGQIVSEIGQGILVFAGIAEGDTSEDLEYLSRKISRLRIFEDRNGKLNLDIQQVKGRILSVSQFTLYGDTRKGNRPGFEHSASPEMAREYWLKLNERLREAGIEVREGMFAAHMEIELVNEGPVTILLDSKKGIIGNQSGLSR